jgi:hypothetical protein
MLVPKLIILPPEKASSTGALQTLREHQHSSVTLASRKLDTLDGVTIERILTLPPNTQPGRVARK